MPVQAVSWDVCMATLEGSHEPTNVRMARVEEYNRYECQQFCL